MEVKPWKSVCIRNLLLQESVTSRACSPAAKPCTYSTLSTGLKSQQCSKEILRANTPVCCSFLLGLFSWHLSAESAVHIIQPVFQWLHTSEVHPSPSGYGKCQKYFFFFSGLIALKGQNTLQCPTCSPKPLSMDGPALCLALLSFDVSRKREREPGMSRINKRHLLSFGSKGSVFPVLPPFICHDLGFWHVHLCLTTSSIFCSSGATLAICGSSQNGRTGWDSKPVLIPPTGLILTSHTVVFPPYSLWGISLRKSDFKEDFTEEGFHMIHRNIGLWGGGMAEDEAGEDAGGSGRAVWFVCSGLAWFSQGHCSGGWELMVSCLLHQPSPFSGTSNFSPPLKCLCGVEKPCWLWVGRRRGGQRVKQVGSLLHEAGGSWGEQGSCFQPQRQANPKGAGKIKNLSKRLRRHQWLFKPRKPPRTVRLESRGVGRGAMRREEIHIPTISCSLLLPVVWANSVPEEMPCSSLWVCILIKSCFRNWKPFRFSWCTRFPETVGQFYLQVLANLGPCCR